MKKPLAAVLSILVAAGPSAAQIQSIGPVGGSSGAAWGPVLQGSFRSMDPVRASVGTTGLGVDVPSILAGLKGFDFNQPEGLRAAGPMVEWLEMLGADPASFAGLSPADQEKLIAEAALKAGFWARSESAIVSGYVADRALNADALSNANDRLKVLADAGIYYLPEDKRPAVLKTREAVGRRLAALRTETAAARVDAAKSWKDGSGSTAVLGSRAAKDAPAAAAPAAKGPSTAAVPSGRKAEARKTGVMAGLKAWWLDATEGRAVTGRAKAVDAVDAMADAADAKSFWTAADRVLDRMHADMDRAEGYAALGMAAKSAEETAWVRHILPQFEQAAKDARARLDLSDRGASRHAITYWTPDTSWAYNTYLGDGRYAKEYQVTEPGDQAGPESVRRRMEDLQAASGASVQGPSTGVLGFNKDDLEAAARRAKNRVRAMQSLAVAALTFGVLGALLSGTPIVEVPARLLAWFSKNLLPELQMIGIGALGAVASFYIRGQVESLTTWALKTFSELKPRVQNAIIQSVSAMVMMVALSKTVNFMGVDWFTIAKVAAGGIGTVLATIVLGLLTKAPGVINNLPFQDFIAGVTMVFSSRIEEGDVISFDVDGKRLTGTVKEILLQDTKVEIEENGGKHVASIKNTVINDAKVVFRLDSKQHKQTPPSGPSTGAVSKRGASVRVLSVAAVAAAAALLAGTPAAAAVGAVAAGKAVAGSVIGGAVGFIAGTYLGWRYGDPAPKDGVPFVAIGIYLMIRGVIALVVGLAAGLGLSIAGSAIGALL